MRGLFSICAGSWIAAAAFCQSQTSTVHTPPEIRVRLLDYKTGRPLKGHKVWLGLSDQDGEIRQDAPYLAGKTGRDGIAIFQMKQTPPPKMWVDLGIGDWACTSRGDFVPSDLLQRGIAVTFEADPHLCKSPPATFPSPQPGEMVLPIRRLNLWLRIRRAVEE